MEKTVRNAQETEVYFRTSRVTQRNMERDGLVIPYRTRGDQRHCSPEAVPDCLERCPALLPPVNFTPI